MGFAQPLATPKGAARSAGPSKSPCISMIANEEKCVAPAVSTLVNPTR
jgi:hypothetical protein